MKIDYFIFILQAQPQGQGHGSLLDILFTFILPLGFFFLIFYFMIIRPQNKQRKERENLINSLQKDDHVITSGGMFGIVDRVKDEEVVLKIDEKNDVKIKLLKSAIYSVEKRTGKAE